MLFLYFLTPLVFEALFVCLFVFLTKLRVGKVYPFQSHQPIVCNNINIKASHSTFMLVPFHLPLSIPSCEISQFVILAYLFQKHYSFTGMPTEQPRYQKFFGSYNQNNTVQTSNMKVFRVFIDLTIVEKNPQVSLTALDKAIRMLKKIHIEQKRLSCVLS